jgi:signal transduction histidine kinase
MTMQARAAQLSMAAAGLDDDHPVSRSVAQLAELTRGALAEMRALIFELRPGALVAEGLVGALRKTGAALSAREQVDIVVVGPQERLDLAPDAEEHVYRIVVEAMNNLVKHARADRASVVVTSAPHALVVTVTDDGAGFDPTAHRPGHLGMSTMAQRADAIGARLSVDSAAGHGTTVVVTLPVG